MATDLLTNVNVTGHGSARLQHGVSQGVELGGHVSFRLCHCLLLLLVLDGLEIGSVVQYDCFVRRESDRSMVALGAISRLLGITFWFYPSHHSWALPAHHRTVQ
jgi:hypothetical protein